MEVKFFDIIIVGAGPAGMTAAVYARRAGKSVLVLEAESFGGQISFSPKVENFPSIKSISGSELSDNLYEQVVALGAKIELERVTSVNDNGKTKTITTDYSTYECYSLIIASGLKHRRLSVERENDFIGKGVSFCAVCDGVFYKGKDVAVFGGGNTALSDAIYLSEFAKSVTIIHRRNEFRAETKLVERAKGIGNIAFCLSNVVSGLVGDGSLSGLKIKNVENGGESEISVEGLFVAIGQIPSNEVFRGLVALDENGFVVSGEDCVTDKQGIFVAGDCRTKTVRQLTTAVADGAVAAISACKYVDEIK